jgi:diguanylate cyclase (GGDEF)-like protein
MITAPLPENEPQRLAALHNLGILDTPPDERFDRLTRLARRLFGVPIALVSLVDAERQWFKSTAGLDACETSRDVSFCSHAILQEDFLLVPDALQDLRFADNPLVTGAPYIRFYAGCPLSLTDGLQVGTLCLLDTQARALDGDEAEMLRDLAGLAEQELRAMHLATADALTGLANRRGFESLAEQALGLALRLGHPVSLFYFDLDRFKEINDELGRAAGDQALVCFAKLLQSTFRDSDVIGRLGGDEFAALLSNGGPKQIAAIHERLHRGVEALDRAGRCAHPHAFSVGAAQFDAGIHAGLKELMAEADGLMYASKQQRRTENARLENLLPSGKRAPAGQAG